MQNQKSNSGLWLPEKPTIKGTVRAVVVMAFATVVCWLMYPLFEISDLIMVYLVGVVYIAASCSFWESAVSALLAIGLFDYLFVPPRFTLAVSAHHYLVTFSVMFVISILISFLTIRVRLQMNERMRIEAQNEITRMSMEREKLRNSLLSSLSHDLRTPLTAISGAASSLLQEESVSDDNKRDLALTISEEADRLSRMIRNILDITKLESGRLLLNKDWHSLEELVGAALERTRKMLTDKEVAVAIPKLFPLIEVDGLLVEQLFINILENAAKHAYAKTTIFVSGRLEDDKILISFENDGPSLPVGSEERIFEKHFRSSIKEGFGLGLYIARAIAHAHGGNISARNREQGGVEFTIWIPYATPPAVEMADE